MDTGKGHFTVNFPQTSMVAVIQVKTADNTEHFEKPDENIFGDKSGAQKESFDEKNKGLKSRATFH
jgi:hypothetical protein